MKLETTRNVENETERFEATRVSNDLLEGILRTTNASERSMLHKREEKKRPEHEYETCRTLGQSRAGSVTGKSNP